MIEPGDTFSPPFYLRNPMVQTLLNSARFRNRGIDEFEEISVEKIIPAGGGVRLQGFLSEQTGPDTMGLVILLHGWEGSAPLRSRNPSIPGITTLPGSSP